MSKCQFSVQKKVESVDIQRMAYPPVLDKQTDLFDTHHNGVGKLVKCWYCQEREKSELDPIEAEDFYSKESYVLLFQFMQKNREGPGERSMHVMYYWLGKDCKVGDKGVTAQLAVEIDKKYGAPQRRIPHGKEDRDFAAIFNSTMMIHNVCLPTSVSDLGLKKSLESFNPTLMIRFFLLLTSFPRAQELTSIPRNPLCTMFVGTPPSL